MKNKWVVIISILALGLVRGNSQTSGGGSGGASVSGGGTTASGSASTGNGAQNNGVQNNATVNPNLPPGVQNRQQLPPGVQNRQQLQPGLQNRSVTVSTNQGTFTNQFAGRTNRFGSDTNLSPTGRSGTNGFSSTNHFRSRDFDRDHFRDEASTPSERPLLIQIRQTIITQISISGAGAGHWVPIHIRIHSGRVSLMGLVANAEQAQRIQGMVSQMPGVVGVENGLSTLPPDQAATETDRVILTQIRQMIPAPQPTGPWTPVSFDVRQGAVGIGGIVPSVLESQRIEATVRQVPGVVQTSNTLVVDASASTGVNAAPASTAPQQ